MKNTIDVQEEARLDSAPPIRGVGASGAEGGRDAAGKGAAVPACLVREDVSVSELEEYAELSARVADDPDAAPPARYFELLKRYSHSGADVGYKHGAPIVMSVGSAFLAAASGMQIGVDNAG